MRYRITAATKKPDAKGRIPVNAFLGTWEMQHVDTGNPNMWPLTTFMVGIHELRTAPYIVIQSIEE